MWMRMVSCVGFTSPHFCKAPERVTMCTHTGLQVGEALQGSEEGVETFKSVRTERKQG